MMLSNAEKRDITSTVLRPAPTLTPTPAALAPLPSVDIAGPHPLAVLVTGSTHLSGWAEG